FKSVDDVLTGKAAPTVTDAVAAGAPAAEPGVFVAPSKPSKAGVGGMGGDGFLNGALFGAVVALVGVLVGGLLGRRR
ncbi:MAG: carbon monoxide dehydrogenase, partial [Actinomycetota bacterium]|nr:carbon monoxide dehydrogenase [Actinomycetota bacterium]